MAPSSAAFGKLCTVCKQPPSTAKEVGRIGKLEARKLFLCAEKVLLIVVIFMVI